MKRHLGKIFAVVMLLAIALTAQLLPNASKLQSWMLLGDSSYFVSNQFTLLNWNIQKRSNEQEWQQEYQQLVTKHQPDLVTLQEVNVTNQRSNPTNKPAIFMPNLTFDNGFSGLLTAGHDLPSAYLPQLSTVTEPLSNTPKPVLYSYFKLQQTALLLVNIHAINFVSDASYGVQINDLAKQVANHNGEVIISGDLNSWNQDRLDLLKRTMAKLELNPVEFENHEAITSFFGNQLDHVYYSAQLQVVSATALGQYNSSDHTPMVVRFQIR